MAGRESDNHATKYVTLSPSSPRSGLFSASISLLLSVAALILFLNNALSSFSFPTHFYRWTFLCCCCGAVFYEAAAFNGNLSKWKVGEVTNMYRSTCFLLSCPFLSCTYSIFEQCSLLSFFSTPFLSLDFSLLLLWCSVWQCWFLQR